MVQMLRRLCIVVSLAPAIAGAQPGIRDGSAHAPPPIELPRAGGSYVDPVFETRITRVTDERDGRICVHAYAYWPALNLDASRLLLACDGHPLLFRFDDGAVSPDGTLRGDDGPGVQFEGASWSNLDPDVLYALDGRRLWRLDVSRRGARGAELVRDFGDLFPYPFQLAQLTMSADDRVFSFHSRDAATGAHLDAVVYDRARDKVRVFERGAFLIDESKISKSGRWVMVDGALGGFRMWEPETGAVLRFDAGDGDARPGGHSDLGMSVIANSDGWNTGLLVRGYGAPLGAENLHNIVRYRRPDGSPNWTLSDHVSLRADSEAFVLASTYGGDGSYAAFEDEIYLAYTDGSGAVRLAHTRSTEANPNPDERYWAQPRAVIDRSGRWVVWTSDLGSATRTDVMLLEIPEELRPSSPPPVPMVDDDDDPTTPAVPIAGEPVAAGDSAPYADGVDALTSGCAVGGRGGSRALWLLVVGLLLSSRRRAASRAPC